MTKNKKNKKFLKNSKIDKKFFKKRTMVFWKKKNVL